jgi:uncharacterized protein (DUF2252 family)
LSAPAEYSPERVVAGARHMSPFLGGRMLAGRIVEKSVFIRELLPQDLKLEIETPLCHLSSTFRKSGGET